MTRQQFNQLSQDFAMYAGKEVSFEMYVPTANDYVQRIGRIESIGQDANEDHVIIAYHGHTYSIHFSRVEF